jgi:hypothetical protein
MPVTEQLRTIHISKSSAALFARCPLAYSYEKIERREPDLDTGSEAQLVGSAAHDAVAALLRAGHAALGIEQIEQTVRTVLDGYGIGRAARERAEAWAIEAADIATSRGGTLRWIEELKAMVRIPGVTVWGKLDVAVAGGSAAPLEIIDWTFGRTRAANADALRESLGAVIYRMIAGVHEPDLRPIAISEVHVPSGSVITVTLTDEEVTLGWERIKRTARTIREATASGTLPARPGTHCTFCQYRVSCQAVAAGSDAVPL